MEKVQTLIIDKIDTLAGVVNNVALDVREIKVKQYEQDKIQALMQDECARRKEQFNTTYEQHNDDLQRIYLDLKPLFKVKAFVVVVGWIVGAATAFLILAGLIENVLGFIP